MDEIIRIKDGVQEVKTGLGWRKVLSPTSIEATTTIPIIDIKDIFHESLDKRKNVAKTICEAAKNTGFFYISGHGVPVHDIEMIFRESKRFFHNLTLEEKMKYDTAKHDHYYGYYPIILDKASPSGAKLNEGINYGYEPSCDGFDEMGENWWPSELPNHENNVKHYMTHMLRLSRLLLRMFALGLDFKEDTFDYLATKPYSILKMAHYPGHLDGPSTIRPHTDYELLTILLQDSISSLEVLSNTGQWIKATPIPNTFVVNIGDSLSMLTNGLFMSTMHRVVNDSKQARYSVPFFLGANQEVNIKAIDKFITSENPAKFRPMNSGEYIRRSLQAVYSKPNIEIVHETIELKV